MAGADGENSLLAAARKMDERAARLLDLTPATTPLALSFERMTLASFRAETSPAGEEWPALSDATIAKRAAKLRGANARSKSTGQLTSGARRKRGAAQGRYILSTRAARGRTFAALVDSGRLRQSIAYVPTKDGMIAGGVWYLKFHITGSLTVRNHPPKRNPMVVELVASGGSYALIPIAHQRFIAVVSTFVTVGKVLQVAA